MSTILPRDQNSSQKIEQIEYKALDLLMCFKNVTNPMSWICNQDSLVVLKFLISHAISITKWLILSCMDIKQFLLPMTSDFAEKAATENDRYKMAFLCVPIREFFPKTV
jgi:hypothetical protein